MVRFGKCCINTNDGVIDRPMREAVRIIDTIETENNYFLEKCPEHHDLTDKEATNVFSNGLKAATLKCSLAFNIFGTRDCAINDHVVVDKP